MSNIKVKYSIVDECGKESIEVRDIESVRKMKEIKEVLSKLYKINDIVSKEVVDEDVIDYIENYIIECIEEK